MNLAENIKHLRKINHLTQEQLANELGVKRAVIGAYEEGRAEPKLAVLSSMAAFFHVSVDALVNEKDISTKSYQSGPKVLAITTDSSGKENIELIQQKAAAGYLNGFQDPEYVAELPKFQLPILSKNETYRAFEIVGDSMLPLVSGTIIIGKYVERVEDIQNGKTYVLVTTQEGVVYKRVFNYIQERYKLFLVSDNVHYTPYEVNPADVLEIWEAKAYISIQFPDKKAAGDLTLDKLAAIVLDMQHDLHQIKQKISKGLDN